MTKVWLVGLGALLVHGSPLPEDQSQACGEYEWFNPRVNACQSYASTSSCGLLGKQCDTDSYCTNNKEWSTNAMGIQY